MSQSLIVPALHDAQVPLHAVQVTFGLVAELYHPVLHLHSPDVAGAVISAVALLSSQLIHCRFVAPSQVVHALAHAEHVTRGRMAEL